MPTAEKNQLTVREKCFMVIQTDMFAEWGGNLISACFLQKQLDERNGAQSNESGRINVTMSLWNGSRIKKRDYGSGI